MLEVGTHAVETFLAAGEKGYGEVAVLRVGEDSGNADPLSRRLAFSSCFDIARWTAKREPRTGDDNQTSFGIHLVQILLDLKHNEVMFRPHILQVGKKNQATYSVWTCSNDNCKT